MEHDDTLYRSSPYVSMILVESETPDNIGAAARAMKNMGFSDLRLVQPPKNWKKNAKKMSMSAYDVLKKAKVFDSLGKAIRDCHCVFGTSRRKGYRRGIFLHFPEFLNRIGQANAKQRAAIVFGRESKGLANKHLALCDWIITIPSHPQYPSLNLAQAVMAVTFSLFTHRMPLEADPKLTSRFVSKAAMQEVLERMRTALKVLGYERLHGKVYERIQTTLYGFFSRQGLLEKEAQMLKGLSRRIVEKASQHENYQ